jgi:hypothetical protein
MEKLNDRLNHIRRKMYHGNRILSPNMIFGGFSMIFCGDFHQILPFKAREKQLLYSNLSLWESSINTANILNNSHQFKDYPEYGLILKRMWDGKLSQQDCNIINERLLGHKLQLPDFDDYADIAYAC